MKCALSSIWIVCSGMECSPKLVRTFSTCRCLFASKKAVKKQYEREETVHEYVGEHHKRANRLYVWGNARTGALGVPKLLFPENERKNVVLRQTKPYKFNYPDEQRIKVKRIAAGFGFSVYAGDAEDNRCLVFGCGINTDSQLGYHTQDGSALDYIVAPQHIELPLAQRSSTDITSIACGRAHTVIATTEGVYSLGNNAFGQCARQIVPNESFSRSMVVNHYSSSDVVKVVCGHDHTLYLMQDGSVYACGLGADGQTGLGTYGCTEKPTLVRGAIAGVNVVDISCRSDTVLAVSDEGDIFGWGNSEYGQLECVTSAPQVNVPLHLPLSAEVGRVKQVAAAGSSCALLTVDGRVFAWGYGIIGQGPRVQETRTPQLLPLPVFGMNEFTPDVRVNHISCGMNYFSAVTNKGCLYTWGKNESGVLGLGHRNDQFFPFMVSIGSEVCSISCGADHMIALCKAYV